MTPALNVLPAPDLADEEPQEDGVHLQAGATWTVPNVPPGTASERALLADFRLVVDRAAEFSSQHIVEVAIQYGCCEVGYIEDGEEEPGLLRFFADADQVPVHNHE